MKTLSEYIDVIREQESAVNDEWFKDDNGDGTASPKKIMKMAKLADHNGVLRTGDYGAVKRDIFHQTYDTSKEQK